MREIYIHNSMNMYLYNVNVINILWNCWHFCVTEIYTSGGGGGGVFHEDLDGL